TCWAARSWSAPRSPTCGTGVRSSTSGALLARSAGSPGSPSTRPARRLWRASPESRPASSRGWRDRSGGEEVLGGHVPRKRLGTTDEVAEVVVFLLSGRAFYVIGTTVYV